MRSFFIRAHPCPSVSKAFSIMRGFPCRASRRVYKVHAAATKRFFEAPCGSGQATPSGSTFLKSTGGASCVVKRNTFLCTTRVR